LVELYGPPSSGKSTLLLGSIAHLQRNRGTAAWIDADHTFNPAWAASVGVALEHMPVAQPVSAEDALAMGRQLVASCALDLLAIDSAAALAPSLELEAGIGGQSPGLQGHVLGRGLRRLALAAARSGAAVVLVNQTRLRRQLDGQEVETSAGGRFFQLYMAVRVWMESSPAGARLKLIRNRLAAGLPEAELLWRPGTGFVERP
jgi:recombination protein RecA